MTAKARYEKLRQNRDPFLDRARDCAELTIPSLLPRDGHNGTSRLPTPYQGMGARGVNNLASKLLLALLPPNQPFFRFRVDDQAVAELTGGDDNARAQVEETLGEMERAVMTETESTAIRVSAFEAFKQLIATGNVLTYLPPKGGMKVFRLDRYVVKRDPMGSLMEGVIHETVAPMVLPEELRKKLGDRLKDKQGNPLPTVDIYTHFKRDGDKLKMRQEVMGETVPGSEGEVPFEKSPYIALRWAKIDGEDYGRGHVEEYLGDLRSLEGLSQAIVEGAAAAAKMIWLVEPNSSTRLKDIAESENLDVRAGNAEDVTVLQAEKYGDFRVAQEQIIRLEQRLASAFLLVESIQRDAERVTAEEIRRMASELEDALGGVYSIMTQEFQLPLVRRLVFQMERDKKLPKLPEDLVKPAIVTGLEALGRGHDLNQLMMFGRIVQETLGPEAFTATINVNDFIKRVGTALSIDMDGLVKSEEQLASEKQQAQRQALVDQLGPEVVKMMQQQQNQQDT